METSCRSRKPFEKSKRSSIQIDFNRLFLEQSSQLFFFLSTSKDNYLKLANFVNMIREDVSSVGCYISRCKGPAAYVMGCFFNGREVNGTIYTSGQISETSCKYWNVGLSEHYTNLCAPSQSNGAAAMRFLIITTPSLLIFHLFLSK